MMKKMSKILMSLLLIVSTLFVKPSVISAQSNINGIVDAINFNTTNTMVGNTVTMDIEFSEKSDYDIKANDQVSIPFPKGEKDGFYYALVGKLNNFPLIVDGITIATVNIERDNVVITFTEAVNDLDQIKGNVRANLKSESNYKGSEDSSVVITSDFKDFNVEEQSITITAAGDVVGEPGDYPFFYKGGYTSDDNPAIVNWYLNTNLNKNPIDGNVTLKDRLEPGHYLLVDSVNITVGRYEGERTNYSLEEFREKYPNVVVDVFNGGLDIFIPYYDITYTSFEFYYQSKITSNTIENVKNGVDISYYDQGKQHNGHESSSVINETYTGSIEGVRPEKGYLRIFKYVEGTKIAVPNVYFDIYDSEDKLLIANIGTNNDGYIDVKLDKGTYKIKESRTQNWLVLETEAKTVEMTDGKEGELVEFYNKIKTTELKAEKRWHASKEQIAQDKDKVKINLLQDKKVIATKKLEDNNTAIFKDLPVSDARGHHYNYEIQEVLDDAIKDNYDVSYTNSNNTTVINNRYIGPKAQVRIPVSKTWIDGPTQRPEIIVEVVKKIKDDSGIKELVVEEIIFEEKTIESGQKTTILSQLHDKYDENNEIIDYFIREKKSENLNDYISTVEGNDITNTYQSPKTEITATKIWDHKTNENIDELEVKFQLLRKIESEDEFKPVEGKTAIFRVTDADTDKKQSYTFKNLDKFDKNGNLYHYSVEEIKGAINYESHKEEGDDLTIINTYDPEVININVVKEWENDGPEGDITLKLTNDANDEIVEVTLPKGQRSYSFENLKVYSEEGKLIKYDVEEIRYPEHYTSEKVQDDDNTFTFINTYDEGETKFSTEKFWVDGPQAKPTIMVQLMYRDESNNLKPVLIEGKEQIKEIKYPETKATFESLPERNKEGETIKYAIKELSLKTDDYISFVNGKNITNLYRTPYTEVKGEKTWINGPIAAQEVEIQLYQTIENETKELVGYKKTIKGSEATIENNTGKQSYSFGYLPVRTREGLEISYTVKESIKAENYRPTYDGMNITNTYEIPKTDITVNKEWINGPDTKPNVDLVLESSMDQHAWTATDYKVTLLDGQTSHTFKNLDKTDDKGNTIYYRVQETSDLADYEVSYKDLYTVVNTYVVETTDITVNKEWVNGPDTKPTVDLVLESSMDQLDWQKTDYKVTLLDGQTSHTFKNLDKTDDKGNTIYYRVQERTDLADYEVSYKDLYTVVNTYVVETTDITVNKEWVNGPDAKPNIDLVLESSVDQNDWTATDYKVTLRDGQTSHTFKNLDKTDDKGNTIYYRVQETTDLADYEVSYKDPYTVVNTYVVETTDITVNKEWINGPEVKPTISLVLEASLDQESWELTSHSIVLKDGMLSHTFKDIPKFNLKGQALYYRVVEISVPDNYIASYSEDGLSVINTYQDKPLIPGEDDHEDIYPEIDEESILGSNYEPGQLPSTGKSGYQGILLALGIILLGSIVKKKSKE